MAAQIIDGKQIAGRVRIEVAREVEPFTTEFGGARPGLATILIGDDPGSAVYVAGKQKASREVGMAATNYPLPADTPREDVVALIERLNADPSVDGILLQLPVPGHLDGIELTGMIDADKDVDGLTPVSAGRLALGIEGLRRAPAGRHDAARCRRRAAGRRRGGRDRPLEPVRQADGPAAAGRQRDRHDVPLAHARPARGLPPADVLIAAVGRPRMVKADWVKPGAIVIDVGMNRTRADGTLAGDVDFDAVKEVASAITPYPAASAR